jgi:hypothetical protein
VADNASISAEVELLTPAVGVNATRKDDVNAFRHTATHQNAIQVRSA